MLVAGFDNRLKILLALVCVLMLTLIGRLWMLQLSGWASADDDSPLWMRYTADALRNRIKIIRTPAPRGMIYDRNGKVLAENRPRWNVVITPAELPSDPSKREDVIVALASILRDKGASTADVREALDNISRQMPVRPVPLGDFAEDLTLKMVAEIEEHALDLPGVSVSEDFARDYVHGDVASHLLGYSRGITSEQYEKYRDLQYPSPPSETDQFTEMLGGDPIYGPDSEVGQTGIEAACELDTSVDPPLPMLQGRRGREIWEVDARGRPLRLLSERPPVEGAGVFLSIDLELQEYAERLLEAQLGGRLTGAVILMDVNSGDVLAIASKPSVNPNKWVSGFTPEEYQRLLNDPRKPLYNKAIAGLYPPGSIFKMISLLAALQTTSVKPSQRYYCSGIIHHGARHTPYKCWKRDGHKTLDMYEGMAQSCDVYFYKLVLNAGTTSDSIARYARAFGLGEPTGCGLPGEQGGLVPDRRWKEDAQLPPGEDNIWTTGNTLHLVIGQGFLTVTPLQMTVVTAAIANGGIVLRPRLVRKIVWPEHMGRAPTIKPAEIVRRVHVAPENLDVVRAGMRRAVTGRLGTAHNLVDIGVPLAGKTGSAEWKPGMRTHAWFACYAPYRNPHFACVAFIREGGHGGQAAGPVAAKLIKAALARYPNGCPADQPASPAADSPAPDTEESEAAPAAPR
ncbi:MAG: penicillin-binding protein 2 [Armatimonadetes bacterium]|nr:penicillin-binding protein 2 [Armatimonadota bacterium]